MSNTYNRNKVIEDKQKKLEKLENDIDKMWQSPFFDLGECVGAENASSMKRDEIKSLEKMNEAEKNFNKNINLDDYRNQDNSFYVYKTTRPLNTKSGEPSYKSSCKTYHQGFAIGNDKKIFYSDYGVNEGNLNVRFWDNNNQKDKWRETEIVGKSNASNEQVKNMLFGKESEKWTNFLY